jgi:D-amino-acid dehydrogenase
MTSAPRVVVVGGGVIGVSCAYYLARGGADVVLLERDHLGAGASSGNAGTVAAGHPPLNRPGRVRQGIRQMLDPSSPLYIKPSWNPELWRWLLDFARFCTDAHVEHCMKVMSPLGMDALDLFDSLLEEERLECGFRKEGFYEICSTEAGIAGAAHEASIIVRHGYHPETIDGDELRRREPEYAPELLGGVFFPEAATMNPAQFLARLAEAAVRHGTRIRENAEGHEVVLDGGRATGVRLQSGEVVSGDAVVLATGPFAARLAGKVGVRLPVRGGKGYHRDVEIGPNGAPPLRVASVHSETSVFSTRLDNFVRFAGTMEFSGENSAMLPARLNQLARSAKSCFPALGTARPKSEWCGLRPMSADGLPMVGGIGGVEGLAVATGHGMLGLTLGPVTGEMIANHVLGHGDARLEGLSPDRFS